MFQTCLLIVRLTPFHCRTRAHDPQYSPSETSAPDGNMAWSSVDTLVLPIRVHEWAPKEALSWDQMGRGTGISFYCIHYNYELYKMVTLHHDV